MRGTGARRLLVAASVCVALLALPGCVTIRSDQVPSWVPKPAVPTATPQPAAHPKPEDKNALGAYFVKGGHVLRVYRGGKKNAASASEALEILLAGPSSDERAEGISSAVPAGTKVRDVAPDFEGYVRLNLSKEFGAGGSSASTKLRVAQVVCTLMQLPNVKGVIIKIEGKPVERFGREGFDLMRPLTKADVADVVPAD